MTRFLEFAVRPTRAGVVAIACSLLGWASVAHAILPIQHWKTAGGASVYFVENRDLPMLDVSVDFPAGAVFDVADRSGLAALTQRLLRSGAGGLGEDELARRIADVGAQLSGRFDHDRAGMSIRTLSSRREREQALDILGRVLQQPEFPQAALDRERARIVAGIRESDTKPETIADRTLNRLVFRDHPYGLRPSGEVESLERIVRDDLVRFHAGHFVAQRAIVAIMGDASRDEAAAIAEQLTSQLPRGGNPGAIAGVSPLPRGETRRIAHPASQSHILIGAPGIRRDDPDYFPLFVGNYVLGGGGFASRLNEEVRQKRGMAYSVYSYFAPMLREGGFQIGLQTRKDQAEEALKVVDRTLRDFLAKGPTAKELADAKQNIIGGFPLRIDSNRKIHDYLAVIGFYSLPLDYLDAFVKNVERVGLDDVRRAFAKRLDPDQMVTVIVGAEGADREAARR